MTREEINLISLKWHIQKERNFLNSFNMWYSGVHIRSAQNSGLLFSLISRCLAGIFAYVEPIELQVDVDSTTPAAVKKGICKYSPILTWGDWHPSYAKRAAMQAYWSSRGNSRPAHCVDSCKKLPNSAPKTSGHLYCDKQGRVTLGLALIQARIKQ